MTARTQVVVWSGGADSTMLLVDKAQSSSKKNPVIALTIDAHHQLDVKQSASQRAAQKRFLAWAKKDGLHIKHARITVSVVSGAAWVNDGGQVLLWLAHLGPYFPERCQVYFGYIKRDSFWQICHEAEQVLKTMEKVAGSDWKLEYPYKGSTKGRVLECLRTWKVPSNCWWTCEHPKKVGVACGSCNKCKERAEGRREMKVAAKQMKAEPVKKK